MFIVLCVTMACFMIFKNIILKYILRALSYVVFLCSCASYRSTRTRVVHEGPALLSRRGGQDSPGLRRQAIVCGALGELLELPPWVVR